MTALIALWLGIEAHAVTLHAIYTASCQRDVGIILDVSPNRVFLLNLNGDITSLERYEIIYFATYPLDVVPMPTVNNPASIPLVEVKTWLGGKLQTLVRGWPVDFSKDKISFLSLRGSEIVIDRSSIWRVDFDHEINPLQFTSRPQNSYEFVHPYAFSDCEKENSKSTARRVKVSPQQLLSDPVSIKRELDRLVIGHEDVRNYESRQQFYAVPEVYSNDTTLGLWLASANRYGSSSNRKNNFTPLLENQTSSGPFGFQSTFRTGSGPLYSTIHEENQTQVYYRLKADYFHFSALFDPSLLLVGSRYNWNKDDLDLYDVRAVESAAIEFGFDYQRWAIELHVAGAENFGARAGDDFRRGSLNLPRLGLRYQRPTWMVHVFGGNSGGEFAGLTLVRMNFEYSPGRSHKYLFSLIKRDLTFDSLSDIDPSNKKFRVESASFTAAAYAYFRFKSRYWFGLSASLESDETSSLDTLGVSRHKKHLFPKGAGYLSLSF